MTPRSRADLALIAITILWGCTFVIVKGAIEHTSTFAFITLRFSVATLALAAVFRGQFGLHADRRSASLYGGVLAAACLFAAYAFQTAGLRYTTSSKSAFLTSLCAPMVPFLAIAVYRSAPRPAEVAGIGVATTGLWLLTLPPGHLVMGYGDLLTLGCAFAFACHILVIGRWAHKSFLPVLSLVQVAVTAILGGAACLWIETPRIEWSPRLYTGVLITGLFATALAFTVQVWAQQYTTPTRAALIFAAEPVAAAATAWFTAGETLSQRGLAGAALILAGVLLVELKPVGRRPHPQG